MSFRNVNQYEGNDGNSINQVGTKRKDREPDSYFINLNPYNLEPDDIVSAIDGRKLEQYELTGIFEGQCQIPYTTQQDWMANLIWVYEPTPYDRNLSFVPFEVINQFTDINVPLYYQGRRIIRKKEFESQLAFIETKRSKNIPENSNNNAINVDINENENDIQQLPRSIYVNKLVKLYNWNVKDPEYRQEHENFNTLLSNIFEIKKFSINPKMFDENNNVVEANDTTIESLNTMRRYCTTHYDGKLTGLADDDPKWKLFTGQITDEHLRISDYDLFVNLKLVISAINFTFLTKFCRSSSRVTNLLNNLQPKHIAELIKITVANSGKRNRSLKGVHILLSYVNNLDKLKSILLLVPEDAITAITSRIEKLERNGSTASNYTNTRPASQEEMHFEPLPIPNSDHSIIESGNNNAIDNNAMLFENANIIQTSTDLLEFENGVQEQPADLLELFLDGKVIAIRVSPAKLLILPVQCDPQVLMNAVLEKSALLIFDVEPKFNQHGLHAYVFNFANDLFNQIFPNVSIRTLVADFEGTPVYYELTSERIRISWFGNIQQQIIDALNSNFSLVLKEAFDIKASPNGEYVDLVMVDKNFTVNNIEKFIKDLLYINTQPLTQTTKSTSNDLNNWKLFTRHVDEADYVQGTEGFNELIEQVCQSLSFKIIPMMFDQNKNMVEANTANREILIKMRGYCTRHQRPILVRMAWDDPDWKLFTGQLVNNQLMISDYDLFVNFFRILSTSQVSLFKKFSTSCKRLSNLLNNLNSKQIAQLIQVSIKPYKCDRKPTLKGLKILLDSVDNIELLKSVLINVPSLAKEEISRRIHDLQKKFADQHDNQSTQVPTENFQRSENVLPVMSNSFVNDVFNSYPNQNANANVVPSECASVTSQALATSEKSDSNHNLDGLFQSGKVIVIQVNTAKLLILPSECEPEELMSAVLEKASFLTFDVDPQFKNDELSCYVFNCDVSLFNQVFPNVGIRKLFTHFENTPVYYELHQDRIRISWFGNLQEKIVKTLYTNLMLTSSQDFKMEFETNKKYVDLLIINRNFPFHEIEKFLSDSLHVSLPHAPSDLQANTLWRTNSLPSVNTINQQRRFQP